MRLNSKVNIVVYERKGFDSMGISRNTLYSDIVEITHDPIKIGIKEKPVMVWETDQV